MTPIVIGSTVQYIDGMEQIKAAVVIDIDNFEGTRRATLQVFERAGAWTKLIVGVLEMNADATFLERDRWRPLPLPPVPVAEFPVQLFISTFKPLIEEAARARVEEILAERSSSS